MIAFFETSAPDFEARFQKLALREDARDDSAFEIEERVADIIRGVQERGDAALVEYTARFDDRPGLRASDLDVDLTNTPEPNPALDRAAARIRAFHQQQRLEDAILDDGTGVRCELRVRPLDRVGVYVPGGTASYPSTVLMNVIPAKVAGVREVIMVTPAKRGVIAPAVLAAAKIAGADKIFGIGGAQAIAALAFGTATIPRVDKIVGPGNAYVAEAKRQVFGRVAIDQLAGPSEVLIVADASADPAVVAADLLAQSEHDARSAAVLVTWVREVGDRVARELEAQLATLPRSEIAHASLSARGGIVIARDRVEALALADRYAPEHLGLAIEGAAEAALTVHAAGAIFVGHSTPEALGDYNAGANHVLPTGGTARFGSPLSVHDFVRRTSVITADARGLAKLGPDAAHLARIEGLEAHARAIEIRTKK
jgi:histidinol dehydrogenase